jgi:hypothetical protein
MVDNSSVIMSRPNDVETNTNDTPIRPSLAKYALQIDPSRPSVGRHFDTDIERKANYNQHNNRLKAIALLSGPHRQFALIGQGLVIGVKEAPFVVLGLEGPRLFNILATHAKFGIGTKGAGLADDVANTFQYGRYTEVTLDKPMVLSRYYDNVNAFAKGRFMTNSTSGFTFVDRMGMAIRPSWNGMTKVAHWEIPAGSTIYQGRAAMQFPWLGGKTQYFVPELGNIKRVIK